MNVARRPHGDTIVARASRDFAFACSALAGAQHRVTAQRDVVKHAFAARYVQQLTPCACMLHVRTRLTT